jgi:hypothetical protein
VNCWPAVFAYCFFIIIIIITTTIITDSRPEARSFLDRPQTLQAHQWRAACPVQEMFIQSKMLETQFATAALLSGTAAASSVRACVRACMRAVPKTD